MYMYYVFMYNAFLAIATNIPVWLKTGFVVQGHILQWFLNDNVTLITRAMSTEN